MAEKNEFFKVSKLNLNNKLFEEEILRYHQYAKENGLLEAYTNVGGDHVTVHDTKDWPQFSLFNTEIENYCIKNIQSANGYYYWYNINYKNCYNNMHSHGRSEHKMIRCLIYYVKVPEESGDLIFLIDGKQVFYTPKEGDFIEFDKNLMHGVEPNFSDKTRISIAINVYNNYREGDKVWKKIEAP